ncbi:MAG: ygbF [Betaproteobacteria bacterium]|nr:ygbF [Betaproteobacteria bacterium]
MMKLQFARLAAAAAACLFLAPAHAALFGDDEARKGVQDLQTQRAADARRIDDLNSRLENQTRVQVDMNAQLEQLKADMARLRGQIEVLTNDLENAQKRQKDFYVDLDGRLRKVEPPPPPEPGKPAPPPTADEQRAYDSGLNLVKTSNYKSAAETFAQFLRTYPSSQLAPAAQYWLGNSLFALRDFKGAIAAQTRVIELWPQDIKAPDAMLNISSAQAELKDNRAARATLEDLVKRYPTSDAAKLAPERIKRLR